MNLNQLRIFFESARNLSFSKAAEHLFISQPAVSMQIKQLEEMLRLKLFTKAGRRLYLTESGKMLLGYAQKIFDLEHEAEVALNELKEIKRGTLHIGTTKTYARYLMPNYISQFHTLYPQVGIHLNEGSSMEMMQSLYHMKNELAIVAGTSFPKFINSIVFRKEDVLFVVSPDHPLASRGVVSVEEVSRIPLIMREEGSGTRRVVTDMFKKMGFSPSILYEASNLEFIKELLSRGEGASFIVRPAVERELSRGVLKEVAISDVSLTMDAYIAYLSEASLSKIARAFIGTIRPTGNNKGLH